MTRFLSRKRTAFAFLFIAAFSMLFTMVPLASPRVLAETVISAAAVEGIDSPEAGAAQDATATTSTENVTLGSVGWTPDDDPFGYGTAYTASVTLTAAAGSSFSESTTVTVNGNAATSVLLNLDGTLTVTYAFPATDSAVGSAAVTEITAPAAGAAQDLTASTSTAHVAVSPVTWLPDEDPFGYDTAYTASVTLTADAGYLFTSGASVTIDGFAATVTENVGTSLVASYTFAKTADDIAAAAVTDISAPVAGAVQDTLATSATSNVAASEISWSPDDDPFDYSTTYTASVTLTAVGNRLFTPGVAVTINGNAAVVTDNTGTTLVASYTFPATDAEINAAAVSGISVPVVGYAQDKAAVSDTANVTVGAVGWNPNDDPFLGGKAYTASVTLTAAAGYRFDPGTTVTIDGNAATVSSNLGKTLVASYTYPATETGIGSIVITDITVPAAGGTPDTQALSARENITLGDVSWTPADSPFAYSTVYKATLTVTADAGASFTPDPVVTINGNAAVIESNDGNTLVASYTFPATYGVNDILNVDVTDITAPVAGAAPDTTASVVTPNVTLGTVLWTPVENPFVNGTVYTVVVTIYAVDGYTFPVGATTVTINGSQANVTSNTGTSMVARFQFPATGSLEISNAAVTGITVPAAGAGQDTSAVTGTANVSVGAVSWTPNDNPFGYSTVYTCSVTLTAASGYEFTNGAAVTINGNAAVITNNTGGTLIASYTFPATDDVPGDDPVLKTNLADGYYQVSNNYSGLYLNMSGVNYKNGGKVIQYTQEFTTNSTFRITKNGDNSYTLQFVHSLKVLDQDVVNDIALQWTDHNGSNQHWYLYEGAAGQLYLQNVSTGDWLYFGSSDSTAAPGLAATKVNNSSQYIFSFVPVGTPPSSPAIAVLQDGIYTMKSASSGMFLDIYGGLTTAGTQLIQWNENGGSNQKFLVENTMNGAVITAVHSGLVLDIYGASATNGANLIQWTYHGGANQRWNFMDNGDGSYLIKSVLSGLVLDVYGGFNTAGTQIIQWTPNGQANQDWIFTFVQ